MKRRNKMNFEKEERQFQELIQRYGAGLQSIEECWDMTYADFAFRRDGRNLVTLMRKRVADLVKYCQELREKRWEVWKLGNEMKGTYRLMVSEDCGCSYYKAAEGTIEGLMEQGEKFDKLGLRWSIEDKDGNLAQLEGKTVGCKIHNEIVSHFERISSKPDSLIASKLL